MKVRKRGGLFVRHDKGSSSYDSLSGFLSDREPYLTCRNPANVVFKLKVELKTTGPPKLSYPINRGLAAPKVLNSSRRIESRH